MFLPKKCPICNRVLISFEHSARIHMYCPKNRGKYLNSEYTINFYKHMLIETFETNLYDIANRLCNGVLQSNVQFINIIRNKKIYKKVPPIYRNKRITPDFLNKLGLFI